ncbi:hypothetical protein L7F22_059329 [Adiantum nelumboides]|nr:hypothetical protein [Adiantum nelumboides]
MIVTCIQVFRDTEDDDHPWNLFLEGRRGICWNLRDSPPRWMIMAIYSRLMYLQSHYLQTFKEAFITGFFEISTQIFHPMAKDLKARPFIIYVNQALINLSFPLSLLAACLLVAANAAAAPTAAVAATAHAGRGCLMILLSTSHVGLPTPAQAHYANRRAPIPASVAPTALATLALVKATSHVTYSSKALSTIQPTEKPTEKLTK